MQVYRFWLIRCYLFSYDLLTTLQQIFLFAFVTSTAGLRSEESISNTSEWGKNFIRVLFIYFINFFGLNLTNGGRKLTYTHP